ncbi:MAG: hypothetical protein FJX03_07140 [Alphaproteobacteria bacterium]|nr:hypothetical protein [Alphaproteobacteria bacterium]
MLDPRKIDLMYAYRILGHLGLDDHTYAHLSIRAEDPAFFHIYPFGQLFNEVTAESLLTVSQAGVVRGGRESHMNQTGYVIHGSIYQARPDIQAIFHIHSPEIVAVSALKEGLMPINQWALHFYDHVNYHDYDSLALDMTTQGRKLALDLKDKFVLMLRHHGSITSGRTIKEALFYTYHLQKACQTQCLTLSMNRDVVILDSDIGKKTAKDLLSFEDDLGARDWEAWVRLIDKKL